MLDKAESRPTVCASCGSSELGARFCTRCGAPVGRATAFDPEQVPIYPLVRAEIRQDDDVFSGFVDDRKVASDVELEPVRAAVIDAAAQVAAKRVGPVQATRVRGTGPDGSVFNLVVTGAGAVFSVGAPGSGGTAGKSSAPAKIGKKKPAQSSGSKKGKRGVSPLFILIMVVFPLFILGFPTALLISSHLHHGQTVAVKPLPKPVQLPVVAPSPYTEVARWSQSLGTGGYAAGSAVTADDSRVYVARDGGAHIAAYSAKTGREEWDYAGLKADVTAGPALVSVGGRQVLAVAAHSKLVFLSPASGKVDGSWTLPNTVQSVRMTATGPVVIAGTTHAQIVYDGHLVSRVIPATGSPVAPTADGGLIVAGTGGEVWTVRSERLAGDPQKLPAPKGEAYSSVAGWTGSRLLVAYQPSANKFGTNTVRISSFHLEQSGSGDKWGHDWDSKEIPGAQTTPGGAFALTASPSGAWGIYGSTALTLSSGASKALPQGWKTSTVGDERGFGTASGLPLVADASGLLDSADASSTASTSTQATPPQAGAGTDAYLVAQTDGGKSVLYALQLPSDAEAGSN